MRCTAGSRAAATSARRARPRTAKRCATTSIIRTWRRGSSPVSAESRSCTRSRWCSRTCILRRGVTSDGIRDLGFGIRRDSPCDSRFESRIPNPESRRGSRVRLKLKIWRQAGPGTAGRLVDYAADHVSPDMSFLEMLDVVNEGLVKQGHDAIAFDSDCREGICGMCGLVVNGIPHGPDRGTTVCQLHMRRFRDGDTIVIEPWRARAFPVVKDLVVDRSALDRIITAGGYVSVNCGGAPDGNAIPIA